MAKKLKLQRKIRVFLDEEPQMVAQRDDDGKPIVEDGQPVKKEEMVTVVRTIGTKEGEYPEPDEGTIFHLSMMRFSDAMKFTNLSQEKRVKALDEYSDRAISGWERLESDDGDYVDFDKELIPFIPTFQRLYLVMEAVNKSVGDRSRGNS